MKQRRSWLLYATLIGGLSLSACGSSPDDATPPDDVDTGDTSDTGDTGDVGDTGDTGDPDTGEVEPGDGLVGSSCVDDGECNSSFCVMLGSGPNDGVCSQRCESSDSCIDGWECKGVASGTGDVVNGCVPLGLCVDKDGDGYGVGPGCLGQDCDDDDPTVYVGAPELCDGKDNSCDGTVDLLPVDAGRSCSTGLEGICGTGRTSCIGGVLECEPDTLPNTQPETCDGLDNDCDGLVDESRQVDENNNFVLGLGDACVIGSASCMNGTQLCDPSRGGLYCEGTVDTNDTLCNGIDDNCDGVIDSGVANLHTVCRAGEGICRTLGTYVCDTDPSAPAVCSATPNMAAAHDEVCDFLDNDCDGVIDGPFKNEQGRYHLTEHCGTCGNNCENLWVPSPAALHVIPTCDTSSNPSSCSYTCVDGWYDADGNADNGCELQPDAEAVYVLSQTKGGEDTPTCGDWQSPCATISAGLLRADAQSRSRVRVAAGTYREGVTLIDGISILGGHSELNWLRDIPSNPTIIAGSASPAPDAVAVIANNIQTSTELSGFILTPPPGDAPSGASIGMLIANSGNKLTVRDNDIRANFGGSGKNGNAATGGQIGVSGNAGTGNGSDSTNCGGVSNRPGGATVHRRCPLPTGGQIDVDGGAGSPTQCPSTSPNRMGPLSSSPGLPSSASPPMKQGGQGGPSYSAFGVWNSLCGLQPNSPTANDGEAGEDGAPGAAGSGGQSGLISVTSLGIPRPQAGADGGLGYPGSGGGGGGAAPGVIWECNEARTSCSGVAYIGASGGSGGTGGCGGFGGEGGTPGGASIAILIQAPAVGAVNSAPILTNNRLSRNYAGNGGAGASGGEGGQGGVGGAGGIPDTPGGCYFQGRRGGDGGNGGFGGGGGGGAGGLSADIFFIHPSLSTPASYETNNTYPLPTSTNTAGNGGPGGFSPIHSGLTGQAGLSDRIRKIEP